MKTKINIEQWERKALYNFFSQFEEPFFGLTVRIDCTKAYIHAKQEGKSFFLSYLHKALKAANSIENFRYSIIDKEVYLHEEVHASPTINRPNGTFGFSYVDYNADEQLFFQAAKAEIARVQSTTDLLPAKSGQNVIHFSAIPWVDFTGLSHARSFSFPDSCPKISFGKMIDKDGIKTMAVSIHGHHGLMDGSHVGLFVDRFQAELDKD